VVLQRHVALSEKNDRQVAIPLLQVDGLVNTTSKDLNLSNGAVSKSILTAAGPQIQDECRRIAPSSFNYGEVIETKGYNLKVKSVFHGACIAWDNGAGRCEQVGVDFC